MPRVPISRHSFQSLFTTCNQSVLHPKLGQTVVSGHHPLEATLRLAMTQVIPMSWNLFIPLSEYRHRPSGRKIKGRPFYIAPWNRAKLLDSLPRSNVRPMRPDLPFG